MLFLSEMLALFGIFLSLTTVLCDNYFSSYLITNKRIQVTWAVEYKRIRFYLQNTLKCTNFIQINNSQQIAYKQINKYNKLKHITTKYVFCFKADAEAECSFFSMSIGLSERFVVKGRLIIPQASIMCFWRLSTFSAWVSYTTDFK